MLLRADGGIGQEELLPLRSLCRDGPRAFRRGLRSTGDGVVGQCGRHIEHKDREQHLSIAIVLLPEEETKSALGFVGWLLLAGGVIGDCLRDRVQHDRTEAGEMTLRHFSIDADIAMCLGRSDQDCQQKLEHARKLCGMRKYGTISEQNCELVCI